MSDRYANENGRDDHQTKASTNADHAFVKDNRLNAVRKGANARHVT